VKRLIFISLLLYTASKFSYGQLSVQQVNNGTNSLTNIVKSLVGQGIKVSNITCNLSSNSNAYGTFIEPSGQLGISKGLLMTTGSVEDALGPNNSPSKTQINFTPGDADLASLVGNSKTFDACVIEFDITTNSTQISFNYIFASEEYPEFVDAGYNDVFAFFISGPGITGKQNLAVIPGTNTPVSIDNVNSNTNSSYYHDNGNGIFGIGGQITQYDGYTTKLKAVANVIPCNTYHLKLAITDVGDPRYDSGVFIEAGSLTTQDYLMIGNAIAPDSLEICSTQLPIELKAGITPVQSYKWIDNGVTIDSGSNKLYDVTTSGFYVVKAYRSATCYWTDSIKITVDQDFTLASRDTTICIGDSLHFNIVPVGGNFPYTYHWVPATNLSNTTISNPIATPVNTITYTVSVTERKCIHQKNITVTVLKPIHLKTDSIVNGCLVSPIQLEASGAENYLWTPGLHLNDSTIANPIINLASNALIKVKGYNACFSDSVNVRVSVFPIPPVKAYGDTSICYGGRANLSSDYYSQYQYAWDPASTVSNSTLYNPTATPKKTTDYVLNVNNQGCIRKDTVHVHVEQEVIAKILLPIPYGPIPWTVKFRNLSSGAISYTWYFTGGFPSTTEKEPTIIIKIEDYYTVVLEAIDSKGCVDYDTLLIKAYEFFIPNLFTPNGDNKNDNFEITGLGDNFVVEIYNRWGERVYQNSNYRNEWTGEGLSDGVYYYLITDPLYEKKYKGWVQLLR
jgi:gliding motility-associated-like protein